MAIFSLDKNFEDVQEAQLLPEDWYVMEILEEPQQAPNKAMKEGGPQADKAGYNIVLRLRTVSEVPEYSGRVLTVWLSLPNDSDKGEYIQGQSKEDWKLERIAKVAAAFKGLDNWKELEGDEISLEKGMQARFYIVQTLGLDGTTARNEVDLMNTAPQPA